MTWWHYITALGGLAVTAPLGGGIAVWLAAAHCRRRALHWCLLFGGAMLLVILSKVAFLGWGIGLRGLDFAGFSGHAARAAAVFPVAAYLLLRDRPRSWRMAGVALAASLAVAVAVSRVMVHTHSASEAAFGCALGLGVAGAFIALARTARQFHPSPVLVALTLALLLLPRMEPVDSQQWMTGLALNLSGKDRVYLRHGWRPAPRPYVPPCPAAQVRFQYFCT